jgi:iron(III) transport system permease protein
MVFGCGMAWLAARTDIPGKQLVHLAGVMPLFVSLLVAGLSWSLLGAGRSGYINIILDSLGLPFHINMQSLAGIVVVHGLYYAPYPFIFLYNALTLIHPDLEEAAAIHGGDLHRILGHVTFPLVKPAVIGSLLLVIVLMAEEFPVPQILGAPVGIETLSLRIYKLINRTPSLPNQAAAVSMMLIAIVCVLVYTQRRILQDRDYRTVTGKGLQARTVPLGRWRWFAVAFVLLYVFVAILLPLFALLQSALRNNLYVPNISALFDVSQFGLSHLSEAIGSSAVREALANSLVAGLLAASVGTVLFFALAYVVNRSDLPGRKLLEYFAVLPIAIPALVMGLGILWTWIAIPLPIYGTLAILVIAFIARFMPQGYRVVASSITQIHDDLEQAAWVAGASRWKAVQKIIFPLVRGGVAASFFLMIVLGMRELTASLFLYTTDTRLLSIVIYESYENGAWSSVASISLIYTAVLVLLTLLGRKWMRVRP